MDFGPSDQHFNTCLNHDLSDIRRSTFNRAISDHGETPGGIMTVRSKLDGKKKREIVGPTHGIMAHLERAIVVVLPIFSRSNGLQQIDETRPRGHRFHTVSCQK